MSGKQKLQHCTTPDASEEDHSERTFKSAFVSTRFFFFFDMLTSHGTNKPAVMSVRMLEGEPKHPAASFLQRCLLVWEASDVSRLLVEQFVLLNVHVVVVSHDDVAEARAVDDDVLVRREWMGRLWRRGLCCLLQALAAAAAHLNCNTWAGCV